MLNENDKSVTQLEHEIDADRQRISDKISAIQERLTPGQLVDEVLTYAKSSGGSEYVSNLGRSFKENPMPVALVGVGLAWLMAGSGSSSTAMASSTSHVPAPAPAPTRYPLATVTGEVRRVGPARYENGSRYMDFADTTGRKFKALTDESGRRAGHFIDDAGETFRGFADQAGKTMNQIRDETGSMLDDASGWASDTWEAAKSTLSSIGDSLSSAGSSVASTSSSALSGLQDRSSRLNDMILSQFRDQPLVGGALAFAVGAAIGASLPHTQKEDELVGEAADAVREDLSGRASDLMGKGKDVAKDVYEKAVSVAADVHDAARDRIADEAKAVPDGMTGSRPQTSGATANL